MHSGRELLQSMVAEALGSYKLELCLSAKAEHLAWVCGQLSGIGYSFPLRQGQLPAARKQLGDKSCNAFSGSLDLGYSKE